MRRVRKIGVFSVAKIQGAIMFCIALVIIVPIVLLGTMFGALSSMGEHNPFGAMGAIGGVALAVLLPVLYGCAGFVAGAISAFVYNLVAGWVGGIEVELDPA